MRTPHATSARTIAGRPSTSPATTPSRDGRTARPRDRARPHGAFAGILRRTNWGCEMSLRGKAAIVGVAEFKPSRYTEGETTLGMIAKVAADAIADAGLEPGDIDGLITESFAEAPFMAPAAVIEYMGIDAKFSEVLDLGGATGA